ncbi:unnamed protein product [Trichobilharzia regenti]|nr:unnamed protein product [Trichobilharzia regenti]
MIFSINVFQPAHSYVSPNMISRLQKGYLVPSPPGRSHMPNRKFLLMLTLFLLKLFCYRKLEGSILRLYFGAS